MPFDRTHVCESCRRLTELIYTKSVDQYLCEDCIMLLAQATLVPKEPDDD
jgi:hypothetical protein